MKDAVRTIFEDFFLPELDLRQNVKLAKGRKNQVDQAILKGDGTPAALIEFKVSPCGQWARSLCESACVRLAFTRWTDAWAYLVCTVEYITQDFRQF
jgi:hypothetical protein